MGIIRNFGYSMKILLGHAYSLERTVYLQRTTHWLDRLRVAGFDIEPFDLGLAVPGGRLKWIELDSRWKRGDRMLLDMYERLAYKVEGFDALINAGGINLHPELLRQLNIVNILLFNDDPVGADYSHPVANAHDITLIGNIAELDTYSNLGINNVHWQPMGFWSDDYNENLTEDDICNKNRDIDIILLCERVTNYRRKSVDKFATSFPQGTFRGQGWPNGFLPEPERINHLQNSKIGLNIHNSTGPLNSRTYWLPANGILQICDNKRTLNDVFCVGKEIVGFNEIDEAIHWCHYYLRNEDERLAIAIAGWKRSLSDYNEIACFDRINKHAQNILDADIKSPSSLNLINALHNHRSETSLNRKYYLFFSPFSIPYRLFIRYYLGLRRRIMRWLFNLRYNIVSMIKK